MTSHYEVYPCGGPPGTAYHSEPFGDLTASAAHALAREASKDGPDHHVELVALTPAGVSRVCVAEYRAGQPTSFARP